MKPTFTARLRNFVIGALCILFLPGQQLFAQDPVITSSIGMPVGNANCTGIDYGNGIYISIFSSGTIYKSSDGEAWLKVNDAGITPGTFNKVAFGAGIFVIVGDNGLILTSSNGLNWTAAVSGSTENLYDIKFIQNAFYTVGNNSTLLTSTGAVNWTTVSIGAGASTDVFNSITYGNGIFAISSRSASGNGLYVFISSTGASNSWTVIYVDNGLINKIQFLKDRFYIFTSGTNVYTSPDAIGWTNSTGAMTLTLPDATTQTIGSPNQAFHGIYDGNKIYLFGYSQYYSTNGCIFSSDDGVNFVLEPKTAYIVCQGSAFINNKYFEYGNEGFTFSNDGLHYKYPNGNYYDVATNGSGYVAVGTTVQAGIISTSPDFITWTDRTMPNQNELNTIVYTGTKYVAAGNQTVIESADGISWTQIANPSYSYSAMAFGAAVLVAGRSQTGSFAGDIAFSPDGITWTTANTDDNYYLKVKFLNGNFFAMGFSNVSFEGVLLHSTDGINWTNITPNLPYVVYCFDDVVYDGSKYHFMAMEWADIGSYTLGQFFSISTATVTDLNSYANKGTISSPPAGALLGGSYGEGTFAYNNGRFLGGVIDIASYEGYVLYSTDGINWSAIDLNEKTSLYGILSEGDKFKMVGSSDAKVIADFTTSLPVNLLYFRASAVNGQALLKWQTAGEVNSDHFIVQHGTDALRWNTVGNVKASGQTESVKNYQFIHTGPSQGKNYYRLIQKDKDGKEQLSEIEQLQISSLANVRLFPNPASKYVLLQLPASQISTVSLYNASGKRVYQKSHIGNARISLELLPAGIYQVEIDQNGKQYTLQLIHN